MSDLLAYLHVGLRHITDPGALDHVLFLLALAAIYRGREWRAGLWVVSAFTLGHSVTLALAVSGALSWPTPLIELLMGDRARPPAARRYRPIFAGVAGLVHGAGFANYLRELFVGSIAVPLLGFNLGIELGQMVILALAALLLAGVDRLLGHRTRSVAVSAAVVLVAAEMALERARW